MRIGTETHDLLTRMKPKLRVKTYDKVIETLAQGKVLYAVDTLEGAKLLTDLPTARGEAIQKAAATGSSEVLWPQIYLDLGTDNGK